MMTTGQLLDACVQDALPRHQTHLHQLCVDRAVPLSAGDLRPYCWYQIWSDTTLGFGGVGGAAVSSALTVVVMNDYTGAAAVYHGGRFAYFIGGGSEKFWEAMRNFDLPGACEGRAGLDREALPTTPAPAGRERTEQP